MAVLLTDQVIAPAGITAGGTGYACGDVLPAGDDTASPAERDALRSAGMLRPVTIAESAADLAGQVLAAAIADPRVIVTDELAAGYAALISGAPAVVQPPPGDPPTAAFTYTPPGGGLVSNVVLDGSGSVPGAAPITRYDWQFDTRGATPDGGPSVTWRAPAGHGTYTITLTVTAADGQSGTASQDITI